MINKPPEKMSTTIDKLEYLYDAIDRLTSGDIPPETAIRLFELEQRLDKIVARMEKQVQASQN